MQHTSASIGRAAVPSVAIASRPLRYSAPARIGCTRSSGKPAARTALVKPAAAIEIAAARPVWEIDVADALAAARDNVLRDRLHGVMVGEADRHVDHRPVMRPDLDHRHVGGLEQRAGALAVIVADQHHAIGTAAEKRRDRLCLLVGREAR